MNIVTNHVLENSSDQMMGGEIEKVISTGPVKESLNKEKVRVNSKLKKRLRKQVN